MTDVEVLVGQVMPAVGAAIGAYGAGVLTRAEDEAAEATVRLGQRLLNRILHRAPAGVPVKLAVEQLAATPGDRDALAALRLYIRQVLSDDAELATEVSGLLPSSATASGDHGVAVGGNVDIHAESGSAAAWSMGSVTVGNPPQPGPHKG